MPPMLILLISFSCIVFQSHSEAETCTGRWIWQLGPKTLIEAHIGGGRSYGEAVINIQGTGAASIPPLLCSSKLYGGIG